MSSWFPRSISGQAALVAISICWIALMFWLIPGVTKLFGQTGYLAIFAFYWFGFCLPAALWFTRSADRRSIFSLRLLGGWWLPIIVVAQLAAVAMIVRADLPAQAPVWIFALAAIFGVLNGFFEEFFWRGAFLAVGKGSIRFLGLGVLLFGLWHIPLAFAYGIEYPGGPLALIFGGFALGVYFAFLSWRTQAIGWASLAHSLTNAMTFSLLIGMNAG